MFAYQLLFVFRLYSFLTIFLCCCFWFSFGSVVVLFCFTCVQWFGACFGKWIQIYHSFNCLRTSISFRWVICARARVFMRFWIFPWHFVSSFFYEFFISIKVVFTILCCISLSFICGWKWAFDSLLERALGPVLLSQLVRHVTKLCFVDVLLPRASCVKNFSPLVNGFRCRFPGEFSQGNGKFMSQVSWQQSELVRWHSLMHF